MKLTKNYIRKLIKEEARSLSEEASPAVAKAIDLLGKAPGLQVELDKLQDEKAAGPVLTHFINMLTAKGMNKSKLVNLMTAQFTAAKDVKSGDVGAPAAPAPGAPPKP